MSQATANGVPLPYPEIFLLVLGLSTHCAVTEVSLQRNYKYPNNNQSIGPQFMPRPIAFLHFNSNKNNGKY